MMVDERHTENHQEIDLLLPWYVNETLDPREHDRVARHVARCAECQQSVSLLADVQDTVLRNKATPIVPRPRTDDLIDAVDARQRTRRLDGRQARSLIAAAAVTTLLVGVPFLLNPGGKTAPAPEFETATSSGAAPVMDYVLRIQFHGTTPQTNRDRLLEEIGARDIVGESEAGTYRVIVQLSVASLEDLEHYASRLESAPEVISVNVIAMQLPVKANQ